MKARDGLETAFGHVGRMASLGWDVLRATPR